MNIQLPPEIWYIILKFRSELIVKEIIMLKKEYFYNIHFLLKKNVVKMPFQNDQNYEYCYYPLETKNNKWYRENCIISKCKKDMKQPPIWHLCHVNKNLIFWRLSPSLSCFDKQFKNVNIKKKSLYWL